MFYNRVPDEDYIRVDIWSAKETGNNEAFTLGCYDSDTLELIESLIQDQSFVELIKEKSPEEIRLLIEIIRCHNLRVSTRKYGMAH